MEQPLSGSGDQGWGTLPQPGERLGRPLSAFAAHVQRELNGRARSVLVTPRRAAILIGIINEGEGPAVLLTRRSAQLSHHGGEVAFPGGMREAIDRHAYKTACREAEEEVGLQQDALRILGLLDDLRPKTSGTSVTPVIAEIVGQPTLRAQEEEVAHIFTLPIAELQDPARWETEEIEWRGERWPIYAFEGAGERLWGMSAYATLLFLSLCPGGSPISVQWLLDRRPLGAGQSAGGRAELHQRLQER